MYGALVVLPSMDDQFWFSIGMTKTVWIFCSGPPEVVGKEEFTTTGKWSDAVWLSLARFCGLALVYRPWAAQSIVLKTILVLGTPAPMLDTGDGASRLVAAQM